MTTIIMVTSIIVGGRVGGDIEVVVHTNIHHRVPLLLLLNIINNNINNK
jgi:hypothetical protein